MVIFGRKPKPLAHFSTDFNNFNGSETLIWGILYSELEKHFQNSTHPILATVCRKENSDR